jgi:hypothetical protein
MKLSKEVSQFIKDNFAVITHEGNRYAVCPYILQAHKDGTIETIPLDTLPEPLQKAITKVTPLLNKL